MARETKAAALRRTLGTGEFSDREISRLARIFRDFRCPAGTVLMTEGEEGREAYLIVDGRAKVTVAGQTVNTLEPGDFAGEMALLNAAPRSATVEAETDVRALVVDGERFGRLTSSPELRRYIADGVAQKLASTESHAEERMHPLRIALEGARARRRRARRLSIIGLTAGILVFALVAGVTIRALANRSTPVSVGDAVARFRTTGSAPDEVAPTAVTDGAAAAGSAPSGAAETGGLAAGLTSDPATELPAAQASEDAPASASASRAVPSAGVYVYETSGFEEVDIFGGSRHTYPDRTTVTVRPHDCGVTVRWDALEERWDESTNCSTSRGTEMQKLVTFREFFEQGDRREFRCTPGTLLFPVDTAPFSGRCEAGDAAVEIAGTVVGMETVSVGGVAVETVHVRLDTTLTGATRGTRTNDSWFAKSDGLLVRQVSRTDAEGKAVFGYTRYTESYELELTSLKPQL